MSTPILRGAQALVAASIALAAVTFTTEVANADPGTSGKSTATVETDGGGAGRYIVTMRPGAEATSSRAAAVAEARRNGAAVRFEYTSVLQGFAARLPQRALDALGRNQHVASIEPDRAVRLTDTQVPATEGLDRVDQRSQPLSGSYTYNVTGAGVTAYVIDTGIRYSHTEFGGRAVSGYDAIDGGSADDCHGHGTHVSGTIGGSTYGMAKALRVVGVRVLDCQGSGLTSQVIAGLDWVIADHVEGAPAVANLSLGSVASTAFDDAVRNTIADGVTVSVSAGNDSSDACGQSPARVAEAITVAASTTADVRSSFSNYGSCVDIFAPGSLITSAYNTSDTATQLMSGTSMASPHVAGAAALLAQQSPTSSPQAIKDALLNSATAGVIGDPGPGTPNRLLFSLGDAPVPPPPAPEPPAPPAPPAPEPEPVDCADLAEQYAGTLSGFGDQDYFASAAGFQAAAGSHQGCLSGPDGVDFDLALEFLQGSFWVQVASSQGLTANERLTYDGAAGMYRWRVYAWGGSGSYNFGMQRP